jgi:hypothetical protein
MDKDHGDWGLFSSLWLGSLSLSPRSAIGFNTVEKVLPHLILHYLLRSRESLWSQ